MKIIKELAREIECNIGEAEEKIERAYAMKEKYPAAAAWFKDMAAAHLGFNVKAHELVASEINAYKSGNEYKEHPQYADGMMAVWTDRHADLIAKSAKVKAMVDTFK